jgi:hypothetical protein
MAIWYAEALVIYWLSDDSARACMMPASMRSDPQQWLLLGEHNSLILKYYFSQSLDSVLMPVIIRCSISTGQSGLAGVSS